MRGLVLVIALVSAPASGDPDWGPKRDPFDPRVIARYEAVLAANPFDDGALAHLDQLYGRKSQVELETALGESAAGLVARARLHQRHGDVAGSRALFAQAAALPSSYAARAWLAVAALAVKAGDLDAAKVAYTSSLANDPPPALARQALRPLAELAAAAKDPSADGYFIQLLALFPNDAEVWLAHGEALVARGVPELAVIRFAQAEELSHDPAQQLDAIKRQGDAFEKAREPEHAAAQYRRALAKAPRDYYLVAELIDRLVGVARVQHTLPALLVQLEHDWPAPDALQAKTLGSIHMELGEPTLAIRALRRAVRLAPWDLEAQRMLVRVFDEQGMRDDARKQLAIAIATAPREATLQFALAEHTWPNPSALAILDRTAQQFSRDVSVLQGVAHQQLEWKAPKRAERWLEQIVKLEPDDDDHWIALCEAYFADGDHSGAIAAWKRVAREMPGAKLRFAQLLLDEHDNATALGVVDNSIALYGLDPEAWRLRAIAHEELGDLDSAVEDALRELSLALPDRGARHRARHHVVQLISIPKPNQMLAEPSSSWVHYLDTWHEAFWKTTPDLEAGYLWVEAIDLHGCDYYELTTCSDLRIALQRLETFVPDDPDVLRLEIRMYQNQGVMRAAADTMRRLAKLVPAQAIRIDKELAEMEKRFGDLDHRHRLDAFTVLDPDVDQKVAGTEASYEAHATWAGVAIDVGTGDGTSVGLAGYVDHVLGANPYGRDAYTSVEVRLDGQQRGNTASFATAVGLWRHYDHGSFTTRYGLDERGEIRLDDQMHPLGLATDANVAIGLRGAPFDFGARVEQWMLGGYRDTRAVLELRLRLF